MDNGSYDVIVVGAGIEGTSAAYQISRRGIKVLLLEQFLLPTTRGSSHGASRITRRAYINEVYTMMMKEAYKEWQALETKEGTELYVNTGVIVVSNKKDIVQRFQHSMETHNLPYNFLSHRDINSRYKHLSYPDGFNGIFEPQGGILKADKCLRAMWNQICNSGYGIIRDEEMVSDIMSLPNKVIVTTNKSKYQCSKVVLCLGSWAGPFLKRLGLELPLKPERIGVYYWQAKDNDLDVSKLPAMIHTDEMEFYGVPPPDKAGIYKFCVHEGPDIDPNKRDDVDTKYWEDSVKERVAKFMPGFKPIPAIIESCIYTWTPDHNYILDRHPQYGNIVIGAGFSGHGFKLGPVVGNILADLATGKQPKYDMKMFSVNRFHTSSKARL